jgi:hypothetical protein
VEWPDPNGQPNATDTLPITTVGMSWDIADLPDKDAVQAAVREFKRIASGALRVEIA